MSGPNTLLSVNGLAVHFPVRKGLLFKRQVGLIRAVDGVNFAIPRGETLGLVGESGCGKSTTARAVAQLYKPTAGQVIFEGKDLCKSTYRRMLEARMDIQMVFQDPYASLNPRMKAGTIIGEPIQIYTRRGFLSLTQAEIREQVGELMEKVGLPRRLRTAYPFELSGGQRRRIGLARALALNPKLILADEPVSALDVSIQAQILNLLTSLQRELGLAYLFISHDLAVIEHISSSVAVMYLGKIVETAPTSPLFMSPLHPYTKALMSAVPIPDPAVERKRKRIILQGDVPAPDHERTGCCFYERCPSRMDRCREAQPELREIEPDHYGACYLYFPP